MQIVFFDISDSIPELSSQAALVAAGRGEAGKEVKCKYLHVAVSNRKNSILTVKTIRNVFFISLSLDSVLKVVAVPYMQHPKKFTQ